MSVRFVRKRRDLNISVLEKIFIRSSDHRGVDKMRETDRLLLNEKIEKRISVLESTLSDCHSISNKKRSQAGDAAAILDLSINAFVDEKVMSENKIELAQLTKSLTRMQTSDAGVCDLCGCDIPIGRLKAVLCARLCVKCADSDKDKIQG